MNRSPLVSVMMPAYNAEAYIGKAIDSVLSQDLTDWELLIWDDGSTDGTTSVIDSYTDPRMRVFRSAKNQGYLRTCNVLFERALGQFVTFLDADDSCPPHRLSRCANKIREDADLGFLTTAFARIDQQGRVSSSHTHPVDFERYASDPRYVETICGATLFFRRNLLDSIPGYRNIFEGIGGEDYFFIWELSRCVRGHHLNEVLYHYRHHPAQLSSNHENELHLFMTEIQAQLRRAFTDTDFDPATAQDILKKWEEELRTNGCSVALKRSQRAINRGRFDEAADHLSAALAQARSQHVAELTRTAYSLIRRWLSAHFG